MADPLVDADWLVAHHRDPELVVLDATVLLAVAQFDHDYRVESGRPGWLTGHVPGALHADLLDGPLSDQSSPVTTRIPAQATPYASSSGWGWATTAGW